MCGLESDVGMQLLDPASVSFTGWMLDTAGGLVPKSFSMHCHCHCGGKEREGPEEPARFSPMLSVCYLGPRVFSGFVLSVCYLCPGIFSGEVL